MKKVLLLIVMQIIISGLVLPNLLDIYKKGAIKIEPSPEFGKRTDWESLFNDSYKEMTVTVDGTIFVANGRNHNIFKFDPVGRHIGTYGRKGEGPGDLYRPGNLSILDGRYLVIGEYGLKRRISVFDFSGKCVRILKTDHNLSFPIALKNNKIAYIHNHSENIQKTRKRKSTIFIKDIVSGKEFPVWAREFRENNFVMITPQDMFSITDNNEYGDLFMTRTPDGNLLVGASNTPDIHIYSPEGKLLRSFQLQIKPFPVDSAYLKKFRDYYIRNNKIENPNDPPSLTNKLYNLPFQDYFDRFLPYYREILVDAEGNILVFKSGDCFLNCNDVFQVYTPEGKFICETVIDKGDYDFKIDRRTKNIVFTKAAILGLFQLKDSEDITLRLVKVDLK